MPNIPEIPDQWFKIFGEWEIPEMPFFSQGGSFQRGGLIEPGELVLSRPITNWLREALSTPGPMSHTPAVTKARSNATQIPTRTYIDRVIVEFPNVSSFEDWRNADIGTIKEIFERKILEAMRMSAEEGKISKASVMIE